MNCEKVKTGDCIPEFRYDTPYQPQKSFYTLAGGARPLFVVFLGNMGHPITRTFLNAYAESYEALSDCELACVVRSRPEVIAAGLPRGSLPFELICDQEGILYRHFDIKQEKSKFKCCSLEALRILRQAEKSGWTQEPDALFQLPLTLVVGQRGEVLLAHYGLSLTDLPADCAAMERTIRQLLAARQKQSGFRLRQTDRPGPAPAAPAPLPAPTPAPENPDFEEWGVNDTTLEFSSAAQPEETGKPADEEPIKSGFTEIKF